MKTIEGLADLQRLSLGNSEIKIAVLDGSVDLTHPCFNAIDNSLKPIGPYQIEPSASNGQTLRHGTAVTSLIFGKPGSSVEGIAPGCSSIIIPIYKDNDDGTFQSASQTELARAIKKAIEKGANIINVSGGQFSKTGDPDHFLKSAIEDCFKAGILLVSAAGNDGCSCLHVPASDQQVLAVGSLDENGNPTPETNFGPSYKTNGILAPGKNLTAATPGGGTFQTGGGTSYATPIVSGIVGLLMSLQIKEGLLPDAYAIKSILEQTAIPCKEDGKTDCRRFLRGQLNLPSAIAAIKNTPGIIASGINNSQTTNTNVMRENPKPEFKEDLQRSLQIKATTSSEYPNGVMQGMLSPSSEMHNQTLIGDHSVQELEVNPSCCGTSTSDEIEEEVKEIIPASQVKSKNITISGDTSPNINTNNLISKTMEKTETNFAIETKVNGQNSSISNTIMPNEVQESIAPSGNVNPSDCGCSGKSEAPAMVYALGTVAYDFGSESHRDSFVQSMGGANPHDHKAMLKYLDANPWDAEELIWTLEVDLTPIYAIHPHGSHGPVVYERLRDYLKEQLNGNIQRISVPGRSTGQTTLLSGYQVANLFPSIRGMYSWTTEALAEASTKGAKGSAKILAENVGNFLNRIYHQMRNLGVSPSERALNYAATNAFQVSGVFATALKENLELDSINASKSPICRPGSDCYDVVLTFFNPKERLTQARKEFRFTIDVSDIVPVTVGEVRSWSTY
jgi:cyanobactin maturation PatA/PatG family protease